MLSKEVQALKVELEKMRVVKEKLKTTVTRARKECDVLRCQHDYGRSIRARNQKGLKGRMEQEQVLRGSMGQQQQAQA